MYDFSIKTYFKNNMFLLNLYQIYLIKVKNGFVEKSKKIPFSKTEKGQFIKPIFLKFLFSKK